MNQATYLNAGNQTKYTGKKNIACKYNDNLPWRNLRRTRVTLSRWNRRRLPLLEATVLSTGWRRGGRSYDVATSRARRWMTPRRISIAIAER